MTTTESNIICTGCDAPFLPTSGDLCQRCEQRQADRLCGAKRIMNVESDDQGFASDLNENSKPTHRCAVLILEKK